MFILRLRWRILSYVLYGRCTSFPLGIDWPAIPLFASCTTLTGVMLEYSAAYIRSPTLYCYAVSAAYITSPTLCCYAVFSTISFRHRMSLLRFTPSAFFPHCLSVAVRWESKPSAHQMLLRNARFDWNSRKSVVTWNQHCGSDVFHSFGIMSQFNKTPRIAALSSFRSSNKGFQNSCRKQRELSAVVVTMPWSMSTGFNMSCFTRLFFSLPVRRCE
jgi:hypothetical protein